MHNLNKNGDNRLLPPMEYTKEEKLARPILNKEKRLQIETKQKEDIPFSKAIVEPVEPFEPLLLNNLENNKRQDWKNRKRDKKTSVHKKAILPIFVLLLEFLILLGVLYLRNEKGKTTLECTNQTYNAYYHANIINTKKYSFNKGKITSLEDTFTYIFDTEDAYTEFKSVSANPEKEKVKGRLFITTIDDNKKEYAEKTTYDFKELRKQNQSKEEHTIYIPTKTETDTVELLDYNSTDIKLIYEAEYTCK